MGLSVTKDILIFLLKLSFKFNSTLIYLVHIFTHAWLSTMLNSTVTGGQDTVWTYFKTVAFYSIMK